MTQEKANKYSNWTQSALLGIILSILLFIANISWEERKDSKAERKEFRELIYQNAGDNIKQDNRLDNVEGEVEEIKTKIGKL